MGGTRPSGTPFRRWTGFARRTVALVVVLAGITACDEAAEEPPPPTAEGPARPVIGLVMKTLTNPFFAEMERGARRAAEALDVDLVVRTAAQETSIEQQIAIVDDMVRTDVDAIVIAPGDSGRLIPVLKKAQEHGIVVVNIDNELDPELAASFGVTAIPFVSVDNAEGARKAAAALVAAAPPGPLEALIVEGIRDAANAEARRQGARRAFDEAGRVTVAASETANWKIDEGRAVTEAAFKAHPGIDIVFAANDMMALGAIEYLKAAGRTDVLVAGYDNLEEARRAIRDGTLVATIDQQAAEQGAAGVELAVKALKGEELPRRTMLDTLIVDRSSAGP